MVIAYVGLGSNLSEPEFQVKTALAELHSLPQSCCVAHSSLYRSAPMVAAEGFIDDQSDDQLKDQPDYINAVAALETDLAPLALLHELHCLEAVHQRIREQRWGPRTLDLDLLLYGEDIIDTPDLVVPHAGLSERNFVLYPLAEVVDKLATEQTAALHIPGKGSLASLLATCPRSDLKKVNN